MLEGDKSEKRFDLIKKQEETYGKNLEHVNYSKTTLSKH